MESARRWSVRHARLLRDLYDIFVRWIPLISPVLALIGNARANQLLAPIERTAKNFLFDCKMCGQCSLSDTGMACPMNCAKQLRNGPCGGVRTDGGCEVKPETRCVWLDVQDGRNRVSERRVHLAPIQLLPLDHSQRGQSSWVKVILGPKQTSLIESPTNAVHHEPAEFESVCLSGRFIVTVEVAPPDSPDPLALVTRTERFKGLADAINITDGAGGHCHMSSVAASALLAEHGYIPIYQIACRDRNRIAIQGDILGAAALGVHNILCLTGDDVSQGDQPEAKPVFDLDAISLVRIAKGMRDDGVFASGRKLDAAPNLFIGATANPFVPPYADRVTNLELKVSAGARFIQTQFCFDLALFERFMKAVRERELHKRTKLLVGIGALPSAKALQWMGRNVPGVHVPESLIARISSAKDQKMEGVRACIELIHSVAAIDGVAGVHIMGHKNEETLANVIVESGLRSSSTRPIA
jgi:5,10-methylenetetrahydrofolate reductase